MTSFMVTSKTTYELLLRTNITKRVIVRIGNPTAKNCGVVVRMRVAPWAQLLESLVLRWWSYLEKIRTCGLIGKGVSLGMDFDISKDLCRTRCALCLLLAVRDVNS